MSDYEANPVAVMEALALGRKVSSPTLRGCRSWRRRGWPPPYRRTSRRASWPACCSTWRRARGRGRPTCRTWDDCAAQLLELYEEVLPSSSRGLSDRPKGATPCSSGRATMKARSVGQRELLVRRPTKVRAFRRYPAATRACPRLSGGARRLRALMTDSGTTRTAERRVVMPSVSDVAEEGPMGRPGG